MAQNLNRADDYVILIPKILHASNETGLRFKILRLQFPVMLVYYVTFNRSQGQSVEKCFLLLPQSLFTHSQLYVGLCRCKYLKNFFVCKNQDEFWVLDVDFYPNAT